MSKTIEEMLAPKPEARPRIYAYSITDAAHPGLLKVGQTTRDVNSALPCRMVSPKGKDRDTAKEIFYGRPRVARKDR